MVGGHRRARFSLSRLGSRIVDPRTVRPDVHAILSFPWIPAGRHRALAGAGSAPTADVLAAPLAGRPPDRAGPHRGKELGRPGPRPVPAHGVRSALGPGVSLCG